MSLSRKRKKELRQLQGSATKLWESQQHLLQDAADVAREAGRQLGNYNREHVAPAVQAKYEAHVAPVVNRGVSFSKRVMDDRVIPAVGTAMGAGLAAWDVANVKRARLMGQPVPAPVAPKKKSRGGVIALVLAVSAAAAVLFAAWRTLRADDELWVADDPTV